MSDRELLEMAAKAAGMKLAWYEWNLSGEWGMIRPDATDGKIWNPLISDGDALRLAVKLFISVNFGYCADDAPIVTCTSDELENSVEHCLAPNFAAQTRRAIVLAAAEIGKAMP